MAHLRLQDLPPEMRAKVERQLGIAAESKTITTYHVCLSVAGKFVHLKSTDIDAMSSVIDDWKKRHPLNPISVYISEATVL